MNSYSPGTRIEPTWSGWLLIAQSHYEQALKNDCTQQFRKDAKLAARRAVREAISLFPCMDRFAGTAKSGPALIRVSIPDHRLR
jgi:hypothetical protein